MYVDNNVSFQREANRCPSKNNNKKDQKLPFLCISCHEKRGSLHRESFNPGRGTQEVQPCLVAEIAPVMDWLFPNCVFSKFWILYEHFKAFSWVITWLTVPPCLFLNEYLDRKTLEQGGIGIVMETGAAALASSQEMWWFMASMWASGNEISSNSQVNQWNSICVCVFIFP